MLNFRYVLMVLIEWSCACDYKHWFITEIGFACSQIHLTHNKQFVCTESKLCFFINIHFSSYQQLTTHSLRFFLFCGVCFRGEKRLAYLYINSCYGCKTSATPVFIECADHVSLRFITDLLLICAPRDTNTNGKT